VAEKMTELLLVLPLLLLLLLVPSTHSTGAYTTAHLNDFSLEAWCPDAATRFYAQTFGAVGTPLPTMARLSKTPLTVHLRLVADVLC
jgi:hypothetical protein